MGHKIRGVRLGIFIEFSLAEHLLEKASGNRLVSLLLAGGPSQTGQADREQQQQQRTFAHIVLLCLKLKLSQLM